MKATITWISRVLVGALFIFSGFIKANDPLGFAYKMEEYFTVFGTEFLKPASIYFSITACVLEMFVGALLLLGVWRKLTTTLLLILIIFFGFLTFYSAYFQVVQDCGCFGEFLKLTPWESFYKNILLLILIVILFVNRPYINPIFSPLQGQRIAFTLLALAIVFPVYTYNYLPIWDFRPYKVDSNIQKKMTIPEDAPKAEFETKIIYKNKNTGEKEAFKTRNIPDDTATWKWVKTENKKIQEGYTPPITDFYIEDFEGYDYTEDFLGQKGYRLLIVQYDVGKSNVSSQDALNQIAKKVKGNRNIALWALTGSSKKDVEQYRKQHDVRYPLYVSDVTVLKTIIRANPGVVLMKDNVVIAKWSDLNIPNMKTIKSYFNGKKET